MTTALALGILALSGEAKGQEVAVSAWHVVTSADRLDPSVKTIFARTPTKTPLEQFGRKVGVNLVVSCGNTYVTSPSIRESRGLGVRLDFSEAVSIGSRRIRWRVDENKVDFRTTDFYADGTVAFLFPVEKYDLAAQMRGGKIMKIEADLPWAGTALLEFDIQGASEAFAQVPCGPKSTLRK
jgi:hypothetical protein